MLAQAAAQFWIPGGVLGKFVMGRSGQRVATPPPSAAQSLPPKSPQVSSSKMRTYFLWGQTQEACQNPMASPWLNGAEGSWHYLPTESPGVAWRSEGLHMAQPRAEFSIQHLFDP